MGKTIALKLSEKEEQLVSQLNKQGISNSEVLRKALHQYFNSIKDSNVEDPQEKCTLSLGGKNNPDAYTLLKDLHQEFQVLKDQTNRTQEKLENELVKLQRQTYQISTLHLSRRPSPDMSRFKVVSDVHQEVDEFLKKRSQQTNCWRK